MSTQVAEAPAAPPPPAPAQPPAAAASPWAPILSLRSLPRADGFASGAIKVWASLGAAWVVFIAIGFARWIGSSSQFSAAPRGTDRIPSGDLAFVHGYQVFAMGLLATLTVIYIVRPWLRARRLSLDGMLLIACSLAYFLDPLINVFHNDTFGWNAYAVNLGSWGDSWPGHVGSQHYGEALLWAWPDYICFGAVAAILGTALLRWLRRRLPRLGIVGALGIFFVAFYVCSSLFELVRVHLQLYSYARTWKGLTLWPGKEYQWPLYEGLFTACSATAFVYLRWSWMTKGHSFLDAGIERLGVSERSRTAILLLAVIAFAVVVYGGFYFIPWSWSSVSAHSVAQLPSYMRPGP